jgi:hypothetical protein
MKQKELIVLMSHKVGRQELDMLRVLSQVGFTAPEKYEVLFAMDSASDVFEDLLSVLPTPVYRFRWNEGYAANYIPSGATILPGNNHFPILNLILNRLDVTGAWCIEYDVVFKGDWLLLFDYFWANRADFISSHIERYSLVADDWGHWNVWHHDEYFPKADRWRSFNPIYRLSRRAAEMLDRQLNDGWAGHHEVFIPTMVKHTGLGIEDLRSHNFCGVMEQVGGADELQTARADEWPGIRESIRYRPSIAEQAELKANWLYHPIKDKW